MTVSAAPAAPPNNGTMLLSSPGLAGWLAEQNVSLALTTYQAGRLFFIGRKPDGGLRAHERFIEQCQGLWTDGTTLWASGKTMLWRFRNDLGPGTRTERGADRRFVPRAGRVTGAVDIHDIAVGDAGNGERGPIFVATAYNCLATIEGLELDERLASKDAETRCGLLVVDIDRGTLAQWCRFEHTIEELYDVAVLQGVFQLEAVGFVGDEIQRAVSPALDNGEPHAGGKLLR